MRVEGQNKTLTRVASNSMLNRVHYKEEANMDHKEEIRKLLVPDERVETQRYGADEETNPPIDADSAHQVPEPESPEVKNFKRIVMD